MQFAATNVEPSPNSKVTVTFAGLMLLRPAANNTLEVGIHKYNRDHMFQVMLIINKPQRPPRVIRLLAGPLFSDFEMIVDPPGAGIQKFVTSDGPFDRYNAGNNPLDFRWSFNLQALPGHEMVDINDGARPCARLNSGVLYTPNLTRKGLDPLLVIGLEQPTNLHQFSADLGASVDLPPGAKMTLKWTELGVPQEMVLPRDPPDPDGTTYTVALLNDPLISDPPAHDELKEYYKVLKMENQEIPEDMQCRIVVPNHKSDEIPCLAGVLEPPGTH